MTGIYYIPDIYNPSRLTNSGADLTEAALDGLKVPSVVDSKKKVRHASADEQETSHDLNNSHEVVDEQQVVAQGQAFSEEDVLSDILFPSESNTLKPHTEDPESVTLTVTEDQQNKEDNVRGAKDTEVQTHAEAVDTSLEDSVSSDKLAPTPISAPFNPTSAPPATQALSNASIVHERSSHVGKVSRSVVKKGKTYELIKELATERDSTRDRTERIRINREIKELRTSRESTKQVDTFYDMTRQLIGHVSWNPANMDDYSDAVYIGDDKYIESVRFDFVDSNRGGEKFIRTTALLTDDGKDKLKKYITKRIKKEYTRQHESKRAKKNTMNKSQLRALLSRKTYYQYKIAETEASLSLKGRIQIHTALDSKTYHLVPKGSVTKSMRGKFSLYTAATGLKVWIKRTDDSFNKTVADTFDGLRSVIDEIF